MAKFCTTPRTLNRALPVWLISRDTSEQAWAEAERLLDDPSPLVRGAAVWALGRLAEVAAFAELRADHTAGESDPDVLAEWSDPCPARAGPCAGSPRLPPA